MHNKSRKDKIKRFFQKLWFGYIPNKNDKWYRWYLSTIGEDNEPVVVVGLRTWSITVSQRELPRLIRKLNKIKKQLNL